METQIEERRTPAGDPPAIADGNGTSTAAPPAAETSAGRFRRKARRTRFHLYAFVSVALLVSPGRARGREHPPGRAGAGSSGRLVDRLARLDHPLLGDSRLAPRSCDQRALQLAHPRTAPRMPGGRGKLLDWPAFAARHFPLSRRHDFGVLAKAYEAYRKGLPAEERIRPGGKPRSGGQVEVWRERGARSGRAPRRRRGMATAHWVDAAPRPARRPRLRRRADGSSTRPPLRGASLLQRFLRQLLRELLRLLRSLHLLPFRRGLFALACGRPAGQSQSRGYRAPSPDAPSWGC